MSAQTRFAIVAAAGLLAGRAEVRADVVARVSPPTQTVALGSSFDIQLYADLGSPVVGWGLDMNLATPGVIAQVGAASIASPWIAAFAPDGDGLAALANPTPPIGGSMVGNNTLLATIHMTATQLGMTDVVLSTTSGDLTEGFALYPSGFDNIAFVAGHVNVVPEPASAVLLAAAGWAGVRRRPR